MNYYVNMAFAVIFEVLQERGLVIKYRKAFKKLYMQLGAALDDAENETK